MSQTIKSPSTHIPPSDAPLIDISSQATTCDSDSTEMSPEEKAYVYDAYMYEKENIEPAVQPFTFTYTSGNLGSTRLSELSEIKDTDSAYSTVEQVEFDAATFWPFQQEIGHEVPIHSPANALIECGRYITRKQQERKAIDELLATFGETFSTKQIESFLLHRQFIDTAIQKAVEMSNHLIQCFHMQ